jgi:hypothetical protein
MLFREVDSRLKLRTNNAIAVATSYGSCKPFRALFFYRRRRFFALAFPPLHLTFYILLISCYIFFFYLFPAESPIDGFFQVLYFHAIL